MRRPATIIMRLPKHYYSQIGRPRRGNQPCLRGQSGNDLVCDLMSAHPTFTSGPGQ